MKLGGVTFDWVPDTFTIPYAEKYYSYVRTYSNVEYFSWGTSVIGKEIVMPFDWAPEKQFQELKKLELDDEQKVWDLESYDRLYHGAVANGPWEVGKSIAGVGGAVGVISAVDINDAYVTFSAVTGDFVDGEVIVDDSVPQKSSTVTSFYIMPNYNVQVLSVTGEFHENLTRYFIYRKNIEVRLLIMSEVT